MKGGSQVGAGLFSLVTSVRRRENGLTLHQERLRLDLIKILTKRVLKEPTGGNSHPWRCLKAVEVLRALV